MGALTKYGTTLIVLLNTLFGLLGVLFLLGGLMVKYAADKIDSLLKPLLKITEPELSEYIDIDIEKVKPSEFIGGAADMFIAVGCVVLMVVIWAYCGTCCQSRWMLLLYVCLLTMIMLAEITLTVIVTQKRSIIDDKIKGPLKESIEKYYQGSKGHNAISLAWNVLMKQMYCCGVDGATDFINTDSWNHTLNGLHLTAPAVCCTDETTIPTCGLPIPSYNEGCYEAVWDWIKVHHSVVIGAASGVAIVQVLLWLVTVFIIKDMSPSNNKVSPM